MISWIMEMVTLESRSGLKAKSREDKKTREENVFDYNGLLDAR